MLSLKGKTAVITGGGSGIGASIAQRFAQQGAQVAIVELDEIPLVAAERETLTEDLTHVRLVKLDAVLALDLLRGSHNVAPEQASRVVHRLARDESVGRVQVLPAVAVQVDETAAEGPTTGQAADRGAHVFEAAVAPI